MAQHWERDPKTGDYVMEGGSPKQSDSLLTPAFIRLRSQRRAWLYAPDDQWGSDFASLKRNRSANDSSVYERAATRALTPLIDDGRADQVTVDAVERTRHGVALKTTIDTADGKQEEIIFPPIGD